MSQYIESPQPELNNSKKTATYEIMHMEKVVATVSENGRAKILYEQFMPYDCTLRRATNLMI